MTDYLWYIDGTKQERIGYTVYNPFEKRSEKMDNGALITVNDGAHSYHVYVPVNGQPDKLKSLFMHLSFGETVGGVAAELVRLLRNANPVTPLADKARLVGEYEVGTVLKICDHRYVFTINSTPIRNGELRYARIVKGNTGPVLFVGKVSNFQSYLPDTDVLRKAIDKVVRFTYNAGSKPGSKRIVRLKEVAGYGETMRLGGEDLADGDAYKNFSLSKIAGEIEVL